MLVTDADCDCSLLLNKLHPGSSAQQPGVLLPRCSLAAAQGQSTKKRNKGKLRYKLRMRKQRRPCQSIKLVLINFVETQVMTYLSE